MKKLSFLLIAILVMTACNNTSSTDQTNTETTETKEAALTVISIKITGMHCASCENTISTALTELDGVEKAKASADMETAKVVYDPAKVGPDDFKAAIEGKGYVMVDYTIIEPIDKPVSPIE